MLFIFSERSVEAERKIKFIQLLASLAALSLIVVLSGCENRSSEEVKPPSSIKQEPARSGDINLQETRLGTIPEKYETWDNITFSADGRTVFYKAMNQGRHSVVINDKAGRFYDAINDIIIFNAARNKVAYDGKTAGKEYLVVDNKEVASFDDVAPDSFSPDDRMISFEVEDRRKKQWFIAVIDGQKVIYRSQNYPDTWRNSVFSPDGRVLGYELGDSKRRNGKKKRTVFFLDVLRKKIVNERSCVDCDLVGKFSFSSDSSRVIYHMREAGKNILVLLDFAVNEERKIELSYPETGSFALSPDGESILYIAGREERKHLVFTTWEAPAVGKETEPYETIMLPLFGPDSRTALFHAINKGKWRIVIGDKEGGSYDAIEVLSSVFSPDGAKVAYPAMKAPGGRFQNERPTTDGKWFLIISSAAKPAAVKEGPAYDMVVTPVFSPDGRYIAYRARIGSKEDPKRFIVIADAKTGRLIKEGRVQDEIWPPVWSSDGKTVGYGARQGRELWWRVETVE